MEADIKEGLVEAYQNFLPAPGGWHPILPKIALNEIGSKEATKLKEAFSKEEIWTSISGLNSDMAPSPDGFPLAF